MSKSKALQKITVTKQHWLVPSVERALDGWIEGRPTEAEKNQLREKALKERATWKPSDEGMRLVEKLKEFIGRQVGVQFWDPIMNMLEDEGPFPFEGRCIDVVLLLDGEFQQAYLVLEDVQECPTPNGYTPLGKLISRPDISGLLAPLSLLYEIWPLPTRK
jgi:hypothetical protein